MGKSLKRITEKELKKLDFKIKSVWEGVTIKDVYYKKLKTLVDGRGDLTELWSKPWSEKEDIAKEVKHVYFNTTHEGVVKAWHLQEKTTSQYTCVLGKMQIVLVDVRRESPTYKHVNQFMIGEKNPSFIKIPPGILKAWKSIKGDSVIINLLTTTDLKDNYRYSWDCILGDIWEPKNG
jgi:dTDP-4-dehydrorhamnose 3,5-epimerase